MKLRLTALCILGVLLFLGQGAAQSWREWTDLKNRSIKAQFVSVQGQNVQIRKNDGQIYTISIEVLSDADQAYIRNRDYENESSGGSAEYPEFSWDRVPLYMHIRKDSAYTDEEIAFLAKFPLITFEKSNGHKTFGSTEKGTLDAARKVKEINSKAKILYYRNVLVHYGSYAANESLHEIEGGLLGNKQGDERLVRDKVPAYDLSNKQLRHWWVEQCRQMTSDPAIDGIFFDGNIKALVPGYLRRDIGEEKKQQVEAGYHQMMLQTRQAIGPNKLMVANIIRARFEEGGLEYMNYFDGSYLEGFFHNVGRASYEDYVAKGIASMQQAARDGKIIAFTTALSRGNGMGEMGIDESHGVVDSEEEARASLIYNLAIFLICAEEYSYFRVHEGYSANGNHRWMRWFPEYDKPLGAPLGPAKQDGYQYQRNFQHASVAVDIQKRIADIQWR